MYGTVARIRLIPGKEAELSGLLREFEQIASGSSRVRLRLERIGVGFERAQHISHILEGLQYGLTILGRCLIKHRNSGAPLCIKFSTVEQRK